MLDIREIQAIQREVRFFRNLTLDSVSLLFHSKHLRRTS